MTRIITLAAAAIVASLTCHPVVVTGQVASQSLVPEACRLADPVEQLGVDRQLADRHLDSTVRMFGPQTAGPTLNDVLTAIGTAADWTITFDQTVPQLARASMLSVSTNVVVKDVLTTMLERNGLAFAPLGSRAVFVYSDTAENRLRFVESVRCFDIRNADVLRLTASLNQTVLAPMKDGIRPVVVTSRSPSRLIVRATAERMTEIQKFIDANDRR